MESLKSVTTQNVVGVTDTGYVVRRAGSPKPIAVLATQHGNSGEVGHNGAGVEDVISIALHMLGLQCDSFDTPTTEEDMARLESLRASYSSLLTVRARLIEAAGLEPDIL